MGVEIRKTGIKALTAGPITSYTIKVAEAVRQVARLTAPVDTGRLSSTIERMPVRIQGTHVKVKVATTSGYGLYPEVGTGIFGPKGAPITPKTKPFLVFRPKNASHIIRVKSVRGQKAKHYLRDALIAVINRI